MRDMLERCRAWALWGASLGAVAGALLTPLYEGNLEKAPAGALLFGVLGCVLGAVASILLRGAWRLGPRKVALSAGSGAVKGLIVLLALHWLGFPVLKGGWIELSAAAGFFALTGIMFAAGEVLVARNGNAAGLQGPGA